VYRCSVCGTKGEWGPGWYWFGSFFDEENGDIPVMVCSPECKQIAESELHPSGCTTIPPDMESLGTVPIHISATAKPEIPKYHADAEDFTMATVTLSGYLGRIEGTLKTAIGMAGDEDWLDTRKHLWKALRQVEKAKDAIPSTKETGGEPHV
jgi:hypothetical protein